MKYTIRGVKADLKTVYNWVKEPVIRINIDTNIKTSVKNKLRSAKLRKFQKRVAKTTCNNVPMYKIAEQLNSRVLGPFDQIEIVYNCPDNKLDIHYTMLTLEQIDYLKSVHKFKGINH